MNLENFKQAYLQTISESANDSDLKNYIRSIVEEIMTEAEALIINKNNYPTILKAINLIHMDNGFDEVDSWKLRSTTKYNPENLAAIEDALKTISDEDFETLTIGDMDDAKIIVKKYPALKIATKIFDAVFNKLG
jgi:hypothetical protein